MTQQYAWESEYQRQSILTGGAEPQAFFVRYMKELKRAGIRPTGLRVLDLGCGTGRNSNYLAQRGAIVTGIDFAANAIATAMQRARDLGVTVEYIAQNMAVPYPLQDFSIDLVLDITSSNSLNDQERKQYLAETLRVLKPGGHMFVRALCSDGKNVENLLKLFPAHEKSTYIHPDIGIAERVFSEADFRALYEPYFTITKLHRDTAYTRVGKQRYKRGFWLASLQKGTQ